MPGLRLRDLICDVRITLNILPGIPAQRGTDRAVASDDAGEKLTREARRDVFDACIGVVRCGPVSCLLAEGGPGAGPSLSGLAMPAIEGAGNCDRQRLERSIDRRCRCQ